MTPAGTGDPKRGYSLLEVLISTVVLSAILLATLAALDAGSTTISRGEAAASVQSSALACLKQLSKELPSAKVSAIGTQGDQITFQLPYNQDDGIGDFDPAADISWGTESDEFAGSLTFSFVTDRTLDEATDGIDYNRDGDRGDQFDLGHLQRTDNTTTKSDVISPTCFILVAGAHDGDVNGDGTPDPIFAQLTGGTSQVLNLNLWSLRVDSVRRPYVLQLSSRITLRNPQ
jgi:prepilin-type N-terminal cleavage/methylation domain-containing protein